MLTSRQILVRAKILKLGVGISAILIGIIGIYLAVPIVVGDVTLKPGNASLRKVQDRKPVTPEGLKKTIESRKEALQWWDSDQLWTDLGLAYLVASVWDDETESHRKLMEARTALQEGLSRAPANPFAWTRLSYVYYLLEGPSQDMTQALRMSLITGPNEHPIAYVRTELSFLAWEQLDPAGRALVERQAAKAWSINPDRTLAIARVRDRVATLRQALENSPEQQELLDRKLREN